MVAQIGQVVRKLRVAVGSLGLIRLTMAAAIVGENIGHRGKELRDGIPETAVHGQGVDQCDARSLC